MRFLLLTPGTGHFYCGSCLRDHALGTALRAAGHEVTIAPLYLPHLVEEPPANVPSSATDRVQMGGINVYLQQRSTWSHYLPTWFHDLLDRPGLLRWASRRGSMTDAAALGAITVSMLRGEHGRQAAEVERLVEWSTHLERPDVVVLSNAMLIGVARRLREALGRPVVITLQGEQPFLDALPQPYRDQAWNELAARAAEIDAFVPVSRSYAAVMTDRLALDPRRTHVIHNGIAVDDFVPRIAPPSTPTIGYLARMCRDKGLPTLVAAFLELRARGSVPRVHLRVAGVMLAEDRPLVESLRRQLEAHGAAADVEFLPNVDRATKLAFLPTLSVLSVPATYGESFGLYVLEALAAGVPVVQPRHGAFPELIDATGGGLLCAPDDPIALADGLETLLLDPARGVRLAAAGREQVLRQFTAQRMAAEFAELCAMIAGQPGAALNPPPPRDET